ncbi:LamG domain-containing protein [Variovorax sp. PMC12]|uniref:LamG domain-containing protein n=1 Tax=Variovorax sp. PMC12 TaxID=2126319 RepID=UPI000D115A17|nr:LamG domain-containing protein [Variovorax sp. PMC12]AVQ81645.1 hypothetical protein C4F17_12185 [Variovorax sp. PMC12]
MADRNIPGGDGSFASVVLLAHFDGANNATTFTEQTGKTLTAVDGAKLSTTSPKFGSASLALDGTGDYVTTPGVADFVFGSGDFTVEAWIKTSTTREQLIVDFYVPLQVTWQLELNSAGRLNFYGSTGAANGAIATGTSVLTNGAWHHVAATRAGSTIKLFVDGIQEASVTDSRNFSYQTSFLAIGAQVTTRNAAYDFPGNIDDVRVTKGVGRYTANFTLPVSPFPDVGTVVVAQALDGVSQVAAVAGVVSASAAQTLATVSQAATGAVVVRTSAGQTLSTVSQAATGSTAASIAGGQTLGGVSQVAAVTVTATDAHFSTAQTLGGVTQNAAAVVAGKASAAQQLAGVSQAATATVQNVAHIAGSQTLDGVAQGAAALVGIASAAAQTLAGVSQAATATVADTVRAFVAAQVLAAVSQTARMRHRYVFERNERTRDVQPEQRGLVVVAEVRGFDVQAESRIVALAGENRRIAFTD